MNQTKINLKILDPPPKYSLSHYPHHFLFSLSLFKQSLRWFPSSKLLLGAFHATLRIFNSSKLNLNLCRAPNYLSELCKLPLTEKYQNSAALVYNSSQNAHSTFTNEHVHEHPG
jgi:hypothetical protein